MGNPDTPSPAASSRPAQTRSIGFSSPYPNRGGRCNAIPDSGGVATPSPRRRVQLTSRSRPSSPEDEAGRSWPANDRKVRTGRRHRSSPPSSPSARRARPHPVVPPAGSEGPGLRSESPRRGCRFAFALDCSGVQTRRQARAYGLTPASPDDPGPVRRAAAPTRPGCPRHLPRATLGEVIRIKGTMAKGRDNRNREEKKRKKKPKKDQLAAAATINFHHHSIAQPPVQKTQD